MYDSSYVCRFVAEQQRKLTLEQQRQSEKKIGELLVESDCLFPGGVDQGLCLQNTLFLAAFGTVLVLTPALIVEAGTLSTGFRATASVRKVSRIRIVRQQSQLTISQNDIATGYLDVPAASRFEVKNSSQDGYLLAFEVLEGPFKQIFISGLKNEVQIDFDRGWVLMPYSRTPQLLELTYRFIFTADARPGIYPWPVQINVSAM